MLVYKYLSMVHAIDNLVKRRIKISQWTEMNDPFELKGVKTSSPRFNDIFKDVVNGIGVLCFSKTETGPLLWSHYADQHRGCCIGFEINHWPLSELALLDTPKQIPFDEESLRKQVAEAAEAGTLGSVMMQAATRMNEIVEAVLYSKYSGWAYEQEVRAQITLRPDQKDGDHYFADFDKIVRPVEVLVGVRGTEEDKKKLQYAVNRYDPPLPIVQMTMAEDSFEIVRNPK